MSFPSTPGAKLRIAGREARRAAPGGQDEGIARHRGSLAVVGLLVVSALTSGCERASADLVSEEAAVAIAMKAFAAQPAVIPSTTAPDGEVTTSTVLPGVVAGEAELIHCDAPGITGGEDMMVWTVHLGGATSEGTASARVYIDAATGDVLAYWLGP